MFYLILLLMSCLSDHLLAYKVVETETVHAQDIIVYVEGETVEDTAFDGAPIWVDSFTQPWSVNGVDILWVIDPSGSMNNEKQYIIAGIEAMILGGSLNKSNSFRWFPVTHIKWQRICICSPNKVLLRQGLMLSMVT